jgi:hypothetical protein
MGRPTTILLPFSPDWRWRVDRDSSAFYPNARLIRQNTIGDWTGVVQQLITSAARWER